MELAMPAGTITEALIAINAGADAIYFGMKEFSARKGAGNFSIEDMRRIRKYAEERDRRVYITINTLIDDEDIPRAYDLLGEIEKYGCDGIIVQDLGIARIIRNDFPSLPLHASTQLAVHTEAGVKALQELGFTRVVLSRELSLKEIERIRKACPDVELKVFIHGALCYGFSGLCMASHAITGRSANEGACAQICRTWFTDEKTGRKLYPFSLEDLNSGTLIKQLEKIGIDSLKVEGRMKGPEYAEAVTKYYRAILDSKTGSIPYDSNVNLSFSRKRGTGFLEGTGPGHHILTTGSYTGHLGEDIGVCVKSGGGSITVETRRNINPHDGLMLLVPDDATGLDTPLRFSASIIGKPESHSRTYKLWLENAKREFTGLRLYMISKSTGNTRIPSSDLPMAKERIPAVISINGNTLSIKAGDATADYDIETAPSDKSPIPSLMRIFSSSDKDMQLTPEIEGVSGTFYINPSRLKEIRRDFIDKLEQSPRKEKHYTAEATSSIKEADLPPRKAICGDGVPWNISGKEYNGITYITMPPVRFDERNMWDEVVANASKHDNVRIGMNNIADMLFAKAHPEYEFFADIYLYVPNREAAKLLCDNIPNFIGGYLWMERASYEEPWPFRPAIVNDFAPPLFISRACIRHDGFGENCSTCPGRNGQYRLEQNGKHYLASFHNCMTIVTERNA